MRCQNVATTDRWERASGKHRGLCNARRQTEPRAAPAVLIRPSASGRAATWSGRAGVRRRARLPRLPLSAPSAPLSQTRYRYVSRRRSPTSTSKPTRLSCARLLRNVYDNRRVQNTLTIYSICTILTTKLMIVNVAYRSISRRTWFSRSAKRGLRDSTAAAPAASVPNLSVDSE